MSARFSLCGPEEIGEVMRFIDQHWKHGHIMAVDHEMVDFMHKSSDGYNYAIARDADGCVGILGFIPTSKYDSSLKDNSDLMLAMWKSIGDIGTGLTLQDMVCRQASTVGVPGINGKVAKIYQWLGFSVFDMGHYFILNDSMPHYQIAVPGKSDTRQTVNVVAHHCLTELNGEQVLALQLKACWRPFKSGRYLVNRYFRHPVYKYRIWAVSSQADHAVNAVFVTRTVCANGSKCERVVDIVGDVLSCGSLATAWKELLQEENSEYLDCVEAGLSDDEMSAIGFSKVRGDTIIPNYFEPFLRENVSIKAALLNRTSDKYVMFRGDGDQDRPNKR